MGYIYDRSWSGNCVGRIESDGRVFTGVFGGAFKGHVDSSGFAYLPGLLSKGSIVGRINPDGRVFTKSFGGTYIGRVDTSGLIYNNDPTPMDMQSLQLLVLICNQHF